MNGTLTLTLSPCSGEATRERPEKKRLMRVKGFRLKGEMC